MNSFNENNPLAQTKKTARNSHIRIYKKEQKHVKVEDVFTHEDIISGVISKAGNLLVCFEESRDKGIKVYPLIFSDEIGSWKFNLWYSETVPQNQHSHVYKGREELLEDCHDFFILLREKDTNDNNSMRTMICCSLRVIDDMGKLQLLLPHKNVLLMK